MKRKKNCLCKKKKKIPDCALLCLSSCTIQDYVYTVQVTLSNPV